jgi:hypothetical protein
VTLRLSGSASGGSLDLLVTHRRRRCRLSRGCPTTPQVDSCLGGPADLLGIAYSVPCTYPAGAVASGIVGSTPSRAGGQS